MPLEPLVIVAWALCAALFAAYAASVAGEITYVTLADGRKTERRLPTRKKRPRASRSVIHTVTFPAVDG